MIATHWSCNLKKNLIWKFFTIWCKMEQKKEFLLINVTLYFTIKHYLSKRWHGHLLLGVGNFNNLDFVDLLAERHKFWWVGTFWHHNHFWLFRLLDYVLKVIFVFLSFHFLLCIFRFDSARNMIRRKLKAVFVEDSLETCVTRGLIAIFLIKSVQMFETSDFRVGNHPSFALRCCIFCCILIQVINDARDEFWAQFINGRVTSSLVIAVKEICVFIFMLKRFDKWAIWDRQSF